MGEETEKGANLALLKSDQSRANNNSEESGHGLPHVDKLEEKLVEVEADINSSQNDIEKEFEILWRRIESTVMLLTYLKSKARFLEDPHLVHPLRGIRQKEEVGLVGKADVQLSGCSKDVNLSFGYSDREAPMVTGKWDRLFHGYDRAYIGEVFKAVQVITDAMDILIKRVIVAQNETAIEKEKVCISKEEIGLKVLQIKVLSSKIEEMERFTLATNRIVDEMQKKVEDLVEEMSFQRQRAAENEQELCRVKQDFESLRSSVSTLITVRESLLSNESQFQTRERLSDRLDSMTTRLESEKIQKEAEVQKLMAENVRLRALLDKKEAQLMAMNEQCKVMAINGSDA